METTKYYKGFDKEMKCRGFQYEEGKTYEEDEAVLCDKGFHACEAPLDCFKYYPPADSLYHEVGLSDVSDEKEDDSKRVGKKIEIRGRLDIRGLVAAQIEYVKSRTTFENTDPKAATAGEYGAATSFGSSKVGENGLAVARGNNARVMGGIGAIIVIAEENKENYNIKEWKAALIDGKKIKADTWYVLENGKFIEETKSKSDENRNNNEQKN